jgi:hypothetical protein
MRALRVRARDSSANRHVSPIEIAKEFDSRHRGIAV